MPATRPHSIVRLLVAVLVVTAPLCVLADGEPEPTREAIARELALAKSCPNPFNAHTEIVYTLLSPARVRVDIYDLLGRHVVELIDEQQNAGDNFAVWKTESEASGTYVFCITVEGIRVFGKMSLVK